MITEDYCSFELAKLLKQKGFDEFTLSYYEVDTQYGDQECCIRYCQQVLWKNSQMSENEFSRPTIQMALKWLRMVKNIYISIRLNGFADDTTNERLWWFVDVLDYNTQEWMDNDIQADDYNKAAEDAILFALNYLKH